jgi:methionyl-tRNA formyltransferase
MTPNTLKGEEAVRQVKSHAADVAVVVAYGMILPQAVLDAFPLGCFNLHASLLPRWRGAAPINRAIMAGDAESGVAVMRMEAGLDTGPVAATDRVPITEHTTAADLHDILARRGAKLMADAMDELAKSRKLKLTPQSDTGVTYAAKIDKNETRIDWSLDANELLRHIHGLSPFPGAWCMVPTDGDPVRLKVLRVELVKGSERPGTVLDDRLAIACGEGALRLVEVQREGKRVMSASAFLHGTNVPLGATAE